MPTEIKYTLEDIATLPVEELKEGFTTDRGDNYSDAWGGHRNNLYWIYLAMDEMFYLSAMKWPNPSLKRFSDENEQRMFLTFMALSEGITE